MRFFILFLGILSAASFVPTAYGSNLPRDQIMARFASLTEAARTGDFEAYKVHFNQEHFMGMNADATLWPSYESFETIAKPGFSAVKQTLDLSFPEVNVLMIDNQTAILTNRFVHKMELKDGTIVETSGAGTQVWSRRTGGWLLVSVSATVR